ncbi:glycosyl transferase group 1 [Desulfobulbus propionicus DSM 2032]|uniref:Glycosyl transferase group 1 n=1 Tax=Desulfobulbus propionicus (strain ATCC 33891 / DSM 2032 / VKM B-1956 / 1pr3) TaxID=577650 RepID=A0A7U3YJU0_DESPD|nr:glycosyltransferase family 1 protein [Desulfobulbus propionicus]ADW16710.1 glycosyl transferase group 1 [Desulfobulbus propionicus DSM 2032]
MRIGVDARLLSEPVTGIGRYTTELTRELVQLGGNFYLYTPKPPLASDWNNDNVILRSSRFESRIGKMLWSQTVLPYWAAQDKVDVFWGATHRLPRALPASMARVVTIHDLVWKCAGETMRPLSRWLEGRLMPDAIRLADRIMADSNSTAEAVTAEFPNAKDKVRVVHLGGTFHARPATFAALETFDIDRPYFLFVGTLEPRKNLDRLLAAFATLPENLRAETLLVIAGGKGWGGVNISSLLQQYDLERNVLVTGYVNDAQLATLYANAKFLVMPSLYEGFGLPLVEAMSYGVPVLTSDCSSLPEVAGDAGLLVNPHDSQAIADGLVELLTNDTRRLALAAKAQENAARFSWNKAAIRTMEIFAEAVNERRARLRLRL